MTQRINLAAAFFACIGFLCAEAPKAESFKERAAAFKKIQNEHKKDLFEALNKSLKESDELYGKKDGQKDEASYLVCYTKDKSGYTVAVHPDEARVGKALKDQSYTGFSADDVEKVLTENFYNEKTKKGHVTKEYTLGHKKWAYITLKNKKNICALVTDSGEEESKEGKKEEEK